MTKIDGGKVLIEALRKNGVDTLFDIPGDPMGAVMRAARESDDVHSYSVRHEQAVSMAAQAYSFVAGKLGVGMVASGPAMTNAVTGLATAAANGWPTLLIGGASDSAKRGLGDFQELPQVAAAEPFCKWTATIDNVARIPWFVNTAFRHALSGRPGPVYLDFPTDYINAEIEESDVQWLPAEPPPARFLADPEAVARAAALISKAERPLLLLGEGAAWDGAEREARELVDRLQIPFLPSPMGKGVVPDSHPLCAAGARSFALRNADLVVICGARFNWVFHFGQPPRYAADVKVIQIDNEPGAIGQSVPVAAGLVGDARSVLRQLGEELGSSARSNVESDWVRALEEEGQKNAGMIAPQVNSDAPFTNMYRLFRELNEVVTDDVILTNDGEATMGLSRVMQSMARPRQRLDAGITGCMGVGIPYALGASIGSPGTPVISVNGDYAFGWNGMEIETAVRYNLPIMFVVANNGSVRGVPRVFDMKDYTGEDVIRYDRMMEAFGGHAEHVQTVDQLKPAIERAMRSGRTSLVNVVIDPLTQRKAQEFTWLDRLGKMRYSAETDARK